MRYIITKKCPQLPESVCAEFADVNDANSFIKKSDLMDVSVKNNTKYELFDNEKFTENPTGEGKKGGDFADKMIMQSSNIVEPFNINILDNTIERTIAKFVNLNEARIFVDLKLTADEACNIDIIYY